MRDAGLRRKLWKWLAWRLVEKQYSVLSTQSWIWKRLDWLRFAVCFWSKMAGFAWLEGALDRII
jgi:hypothetical protein